jgi:hypothetical protein
VGKFHVKFGKKNNFFLFFKVFVALLTLSIISPSFSQNRPQNLCRDAEERGFTFAADPSDCSRYLWCDIDPNSQAIRRVVQLQCLDPNPFFIENYCTSSNTHCEPISVLCPPANQNDIMVGIFI